MDEEVDLKLTAKGNETENCLIVRSLILKSQDGYLSIRVSEEDTDVLL